MTDSFTTAERELAALRGLQHLDRIKKIERINAITSRHVGMDGLCQCCGQPWPCDLARVMQIAGANADGEL